MANEDAVRHLYDQLMSINEDAFAMGLFDAAYHALASALHIARQLQDEAALQKVEDIANAQLSWIDRNAPKYGHSSQSARLRGHESIYSTLARQAVMYAEMVYRRRKWPGPEGKTRE